MLLRNFKELVKGMCTTDIYTSGTRVDFPNVIRYNGGGYLSNIIYNYTGPLTGDSTAIAAYKSNDLPPTGDTKSAFPVLLLGDGDTPVQETDYCLENLIDQGKALVHLHNKRVYGNTVYLSHTVINTSEEDVIVKEMGIVKRTITNSTYEVYLMTRTVFEEPVVIKPGTSCTFTEQVSF